MKATMIIYLDYLEKFRKLTNEQFGQLIRYGMDYQINGVVPDIDDPLLELAFDSFRFSIDQNNRKYDEIVEARREAGRKGNAVRWGKQQEQKNLTKIANATSASQKSQKLANIALTDTDTDTDTVTDTETDTVTDTVTEIKNIKPIKKEKEKKESRYFPNDDRLEEAFKEFQKMRKAIKKPMTERAVTLMLAKLQKMTLDPDEQVRILEQSITNCWQDIYELKDKRRNGGKGEQSLAEKWGLGGFT